MHHREFIEQLDEARIVRAIASVEQRTSGEVRVYVSHKERHDALAFAKKRFQELGMTRTKQRNAVLIYIVPRTRQVAVVGDVRIHEKCGEACWKEIVHSMATRMKEGQFTDAVVEAIHAIGDLLQRHFARMSNDTDELPNQVADDRRESP